MKYFVVEKLCTTEEEKQITAITTVQEILRLLLLQVSNLLKADDTRGFYIMLKVMKEHGNKETKKLADHMMNRLDNSASDRVSVPNNGVKGLSVFVNSYVHDLLASCMYPLC